MTAARGSGQDVLVAVAVDVGPDGRAGRVRGHGVCDPDTAVAGRVLMPFDEGGCESRQHVEVAVAVDIRGRDAARAVRGRHRVRGPDAAVARVVLVPDDGIGGVPRRQDVRIPVAVHVRQVDVARARHAGGDGVARPDGAVARLVLVPTDGVVPVLRDRQVLVAVAVHVARGRVQGAADPGGDRRLRREGEVRGRRGAGKRREDPGAEERSEPDPSSHTCQCSGNGNVTRNVRKWTRLFPAGPTPMTYTVGSAARVQRPQGREERDGTDVA